MFVSIPYRFQPNIVLVDCRYQIENNYLSNDLSNPRPGYCPFNPNGAWLIISTQDICEWVSIIIQGRGLWNQYVKTYKVMYTINGRDWFYYDK
jgi:hypothetical protein